MSLTDLGNVIGPQGPTGATGATGPQGPPGPDLEIRTVSKTASETTYSNGLISTRTVTAPTVSGYHPISAYGGTDHWEIAASIQGISGNTITYTLLSTYNYGSAQTISVKTDITVLYQAD